MYFKYMDLKNRNLIFKNLAAYLKLEWESRMSYIEIAPRKMLLK